MRVRRAAQNHFTSGVSGVAGHCRGSIRMRTSSHVGPLVRLRNDLVSFESSSE